MTLPPTKLSDRAYLGAKAVEALEQDLDSALYLLSLLETDFYGLSDDLPEQAIALYKRLLAHRNERNGLE